MTSSSDSPPKSPTRRQLTVAALALLAGVGWARQVSAEPQSPD